MNAFIGLAWCHGSHIRLWFIGLQPFTLRSRAKGWCDCVSPVSLSAAFASSVVAELGAWDFGCCLPDLFAFGGATSSVWCYVVSSLDLKLEFGGSSHFAAARHQGLLRTLP